MSRRASFFARTHPGIRRVRFPDEIVFEESIKEADGEVIISMLRRASLDIDINRINMAGMSALHQAVLDANLVVVRLLLIHGADPNLVDADSWTPLHAAAANGHSNITRYLLLQGADRSRRTADGETALELVEEDDYKTMAVLMNTKEEVEKERRKSVVKEKQEKKEPAWVRRESVQEAVRKESLQEAEHDTRRKGSAWVGRDEIPEEEEEEDESEPEIIVEKVIKNRQRRQGRLELPPVGEESFVIEKDRER